MSTLPLGNIIPGHRKDKNCRAMSLPMLCNRGKGRVKPTKQGKGMSVNDSPALENAADVMGKKAANGKRVDITGKGSGIQKQEANTFKVASGWGLQQIATHLNVTVETLKEANQDKLKTWGNVQGFNAGEEIVIPGSPNNKTIELIENRLYGSDKTYLDTEKEELNQFSPNYWLRRALCGSPYLSNLFAGAHEG
jgi:hypothetical protein